MFGRFAGGFCLCALAGGFAALTSCSPAVCCARDRSDEALQTVLRRLDDLEGRLLQGVATANHTPVSWADGDIEKKLFNRDDIEQAVKRMARQVSKDYTGRDLLIVGLMSGVFLFMADFAREIEIPHEVQFVAVSSYGAGTVSSGNVKIKKDLETPVQGRHVLLLDEICDSGHTLASLGALMRDRGAASVRSCVLLDKVSRRTVPLQPDYVGLVCPDEFVVGYGMDFREKYRSLPYIGVLRPALYS